MGPKFSLQVILNVLFSIYSALLLRSSVSHHQHLIFTFFTPNMVFYVSIFLCSSKLLPSFLSLPPLLRSYVLVSHTVQLSYARNLYIFFSISFLSSSMNTFSSSCLSPHTRSNSLLVVSVSPHDRLFTSSLPVIHVTQFLVNAGSLLGVAVA